MNFSPENYEHKDFVNEVNNVLKKYDFIDAVCCPVEDSLPWIYIIAKRTIKSNEALKILNELQKNIIDEILFNSLNGNELKIVVNGKFHFTKDEQENFKLMNNFDETYAHDFGITIDEMKNEYGLNKNKKKSK